MKRRRLLIGLGGLAGAGTALGTGAFSRISANRDVTVNVAGDTDAFLKLDASSSPNGDAFATNPEQNDGLLALDFSDTAVGGQGLGTDSVYNFDDVLTVTNQGTQPVYVWATFSGGSGNFTPSGSNTDIWLYPGSDSSKKLRDSSDDVLQLAVGETAHIGVHVNTHTITQDQELTVTINADAEQPSGSTVVSPSQPSIAYVTKGSTAAPNRFGSIGAALTNGPWETIRVASAQSPYVADFLDVSTDGLTIEGMDPSDPPTIEVQDHSGIQIGYQSTQSGVVSISSSDVTVRNVEITNVDQSIWTPSGYTYSAQTLFYVNATGFEMENVDIKTRGYALITSDTVSSPSLSDIHIGPESATNVLPAMLLQTTWSSVNGTSVSNPQEIVNQLYEDGVRPLDRGIFVVSSGTDNYYPAQTSGPYPTKT